MRIQKLALRILAVGLAGAMSASASMVFTTEESFLPAINPGYNLNDFNDLPSVPTYLGASRSYAGGSGPFAYTITAPPHGLYSVAPGGNKAISTFYYYEPLLVTFSSANVTAVGGLFSLTTGTGGASSGTVKVTLSDGTSQTFDAGLFRGFVTSYDGPVITSLSLASLTANAYPTLDHFYVGTTPVPEPTTMIAGALLLLPLGASTLRLLRRR